MLAGGSSVGDKVRSLASLLLATSFLINPNTASAQSTADVQVSQAVVFEIPSGQLSAALVKFSHTTGTQLFLDAGIVRGKSTPGVRGSFTRSDALDRLLAGTKLRYRLHGDTLTVFDPDALDAVAADSAGTTLLQPIVIQGERGSIWGPVDGYAASSSAVATKSGTALTKTSRTVVVVGREQMDTQDAQTVPQALRYTPGILTERNGADERADFLYSRGFDLDEYLDGTRIIPGTWTTPKVESFGLERIDVVKGPASVLYGQGSPGGLASLVSKRPTEERFGEASILVGNRSRVESTIDLGGSVTEDGSLTYRLSVLGRRADTQVDGIGEERLYVAPALTWQPDVDTSLTVLGHYMRDPDVGVYYKLPALGTVLANPNGQIPTSFRSGDPSFDHQERTQSSLGYNFEHRFDSDVTLRQNARFTRVDGDYDILVVNRLEADGHTLRRSAYSAVETTDTFAIDTQLEASVDTGPFSHTVLGGIDYQLLSSDRVDSFGAISYIDYLKPIYNQNIGTTIPFLDTRQRNDQIGIYLQDQIEFSGWTFVGGGRYDWAWSDTTDNFTGTKTTQRDSAFTGHVGLLYSFDSGIAPYVSYSESFKPVTGTDFSGNAFVPTTGQQFEMGVKYQPPGTSSLFTLSAFHLTQQNVLTADNDPAHIAVDPFAQIQTGEIRSMGLEAQANLELTSNLTLLASYAYLDNEITKSNDGTVGLAPVYQPEHVASAWLDYTFEMGPFEGLNIGAGARYVGRSYGTADNTLKVPSYILVDGGLRYDFGKRNPNLEGLSLAVNVKNLLDKTYVSGCQNINTCYYGSRRSVTAKLSYRW